MKNFLKKLLKKSYILIGFFIFFWILRDVDFGHLKDSFSKINFLYFILALSLYLPTMFVQSYRWKKIMDAQNIHYSTKEAILMFGSATLLGLITPGKIGDFSRVVHLKKDKHSLTKSFLNVFLDKFSDLVFAFLFVGISLISLPLIPDLPFNFAVAAWWFILIIVIAVSIFFLIYKNQRLRNSFKIVLSELKKFNYKYLISIFSITVIIWSMYFIYFYLTAASIGLSAHVDFFYLSFTAALIVIATFLPISILNIGTRETILIFLLSPFGISKEQIILFSLLILIGLVALAVLSFFCWLKKPPL
ncbi:flippase-like domain-containing protein [Patescibacteria group bacterium]|nr:flippase-like domain-containing protein [Patescibacteria group bacterium]